MAHVQARLALLIDADNVSPKFVQVVIDEAVALGLVSVRRIYGDFTAQNMSGWRECLLQYAIQPIQQFRNSIGKNATDSALIIDAMDLLHSKRFDGFCIVSSDGDFTRLVARIREDGLQAFGFGEQKTPDAFVKACDRFFRLETLVEQSNQDQVIDMPDDAGAKKYTPKLYQFLSKVVTAAAENDGWANLGTVGQLITQRKPDFDARTFGHAKLSGLIRDTGWFELTAKNDRIRLKP